MRARVDEALAILGEHAALFGARSYVCDPELCGHAESVILSAAQAEDGRTWVPVCYDVRSLQRAMRTWVARGRGDIRDALLCGPFINGLRAGAPPPATG